LKALNLPDSRVTVGRYAQLLANITAREVVGDGAFIKGGIDISKSS
jgi:hypothetical protein